MLAGAGESDAVAPQAVAVNADPEIRRSLLVEEYKAIRAKSAEARNNQQTIMQWSLAVAGIVVAGVITGARDNSEEYRLAVAFVMCTAVPLILLCALAVWLSEVSRMLRAAQYLRARENAFADSLGGWPKSEGDYFANLPLVWESLLESSAAWKGKADLGYIAVIGMYTSLILGANAVGEWVLWNLDRRSPFFFWVSLGGTASTVVALFLLLGLAWSLRRRRLT
ncbi:hypothetical protein BKA19_0162 [Blastococcus saxobsidens]|uniref:Uncharacterized protein n=1 Tax=Blastococcus saxobsidens TaxID=138336 RepID=A0A4Q7Y2F8_9ACTN|nr:hypothetical protein BKA19_0162 [Blastococcus saxobsidens]